VLPISSVVTLSARAEFVIDLIAGLGVAVYISGPLIVLTHELGHALAVIRAGKRPIVQVGVQPARISCRLRRLELHFNPRMRLEDRNPAFLGSCRYDRSGLTVAQLRRIHAAGPRASVATGVVFAVLAYLLTEADPFVYWSVAGAAFLAFAVAMLNLLPSYGGRFTSDGANIAKLRGLDPATVLYPASPDSR
jgi:hypothetical protein